MNQQEHCATCHPEKMADQAHMNQKPKQKKAFWSFDALLPAILGILVIVSIVQTMTLANMKETLRANAQGVLAPQASLSPAVQPAVQSANPYQGLPSQVGGC